MADFDDDAVDMAARQPTRHRPAGSGDMEDEGESELGDGQHAGTGAPQQRPPMKGWGDSGNAPAQPQNVAAAIVVESGSISTNMNDDGPVSNSSSSSDSKQPTGFGRRAAAGKAAPKDKYDSDVITDITEIPDLEAEAPEDNLANAVAEAPNVRSTNRVQALQELDSQIMFSLPSAMGDGIDLSLLTSALSPQENVAEADQLWEFDQLFADVSSEMLAEADPGEKEEGEEGEGEGDDENAGVAKGDGKKAAPIRDRSQKPAAAADQSQEQKANN